MKKTTWRDAYPAPPRSFHETVTRTLAALPEEKEKEIISMKTLFHTPLKKGLVFAVIACLVLTTGAFALGRISSLVGTSSSIPTYTELPTAAQAEKELGFAPAMRETFSNGYTFQSATMGHVKGLDEDGNVLGTAKELGIDYAKAGDTVTVYIQDKILTGNDTSGEASASVNGVSLYYSTHVYKTLPTGYVMTEQDKQDEATGKYVFSCGDVASVELSTVQNVAWEQDGHQYSILATDSTLTQTGLLQMATELLAAQ